MNGPLLTFYILAVMLVLSALRVITARNPVHAALFLVLCFFTAAAIWLLAQAEFLAIALILVYVGAVMVLFLFVVMMLDINLDKLREGFWGNLPLAAGVGLLMAGEMAVLLWRSFGAERIATVASPPVGYSNTRALGQVLYTDYVFAFEIAAVILLVAIVAAIAITLRTRKATKYQDAHAQLAVKPSDRLRIVKMKSEGVE